MLESLQNYSGALALLALLLGCAALILLIILLSRQKREGEKSRERAIRAEEARREQLNRPDFYAAQDQQTGLILQMMEARSQEEAQRMAQLSARLDSFGETQETRLHRVSATLDEKLTQNETRIERMRDTLNQSVSKLQEENSKKLEEMRLTVDEKLHATLDKRLGESFSLVSQRLEQVYKGLGEMQTLASGVGDLKKVLTNVKTRGVWGEMQLGALLSQVLSPNQYDENVAVVPDSSQRVEFAVKLPGQGESTVYLPIDSKFPIEDYERLLSAYDTGDQSIIAAATAALQTALKTEARRIAGKYIVPPYTTDFAIMFLPIEGLYAEALRARGLTEELQEKLRIVVAGPTTLNALLTSLQVGFRTLAIEKRTDEVWQLLSAVKTEFGNFSRILDATQKKLHAASESIESASRKSRTIERKLRKVEALEDADSGVHLLEDEDSDLPLLTLPDDSSASSALD
ncbi:MAG: DNA recombination protein RmuC [Clostridia bacterium]|nr:DNA recombination protein RmuC [Clostridia bacterium]